MMIRLMAGFAAELAASVAVSSARLDFPGGGAQFHLAHSLGKLEGAKRLPDVALQGRHLQKTWQRLKKKINNDGDRIPPSLPLSSLTCTTITVLLPFPRES